MATEYKIIKWRGGLKDDLIIGNLLPREGYICTDTGEFCFCYSAGKVKWYTSKEDIQALLGSSNEAYTALLQLISDLGEETIFTSLLNTQNEINTARGTYPDLGGRLDEFTSHLAETVDDKTLLDRTYPVGAIYMSAVSTSPATLFGGTWLQITGGFLYANTSAGGTGGANTHSHSLDDGYAMLSSAASGVAWSYKIVPSWDSNWKVNGFSEEAHVQTRTDGVILGGATSSESTLPAYYTVYCWKRTV